MANEEQLNESTLSRVYQHATSDRPFLIVTAFRNEYTRDENLQRNRILAAKVRNAGYGYFFLDGSWIEKDSEGNEIHSSEDSLFVIGNENDSGRLKYLGKKWMEEYNQDAVIYKPEGTQSVRLIYKDGSEEELGKFSPDKISSEYSKLRGRGDRTFVFESAKVDIGWIKRMVS